MNAISVWGRVAVVEKLFFRRDYILYCLLLCNFSRRWTGRRHWGGWEGGFDPLPSEGWRGGGGERSYLTLWPSALTSRPPSFNGVIFPHLPRPPFPSPRRTHCTPTAPPPPPYLSLSLSKICTDWLGIYGCSKMATLALKRRKRSGRRPWAAGEDLKKKRGKKRRLGGLVLARAPPLTTDRVHTRLRMDAWGRRREMSDIDCGWKKTGGPEGVISPPPIPPSVSPGAGLELFNHICSEGRRPAARPSNLPRLLRRRRRFAWVCYWSSSR